MQRMILGALMTLSLSGADSAHSFSLKTIDGSDMPLAAYKGKVVLLVNTASQWGFTPQYSGLESLYKQYIDKGLVVLGVPANNFGGQEPGTNEEIKLFCTRNYKVSFPMAAKVSVKGSDQHPLYKFLSDAAGLPDWNFNKYLIDKDGKVLKRFRSPVAPQSPELVGAIEAALK